MKILFLISRKEKPSARLRVFSYFPFLKKKGVEIDWVEFKGISKDRFLALIKLRRYDLCVIQKKLLGSLELQIIRTLCPKLVYDFDDAVVFQDDGTERKDSQKLFQKVLQAADLVICGNDYLKNLALPWNRNLVVLPTPVDTEKVIPRGSCISPHPIIGWLGSKANFPFFSACEKNWQAIKQMNPVQFLVVSSEKIPLKMDYEFVLWEEKFEYDILKRFDIGLAPLPDNRFTRGKCAYKILQYQASGVPAIASRVGYNEEVICQMETGILVGQDLIWEEAVSRLVGNPELFRKISLQAREYVCETHDLKKLEPRFLNTLKSL